MEEEEEDDVAADMKNDGVELVMISPARSTQAASKRSLSMLKSIFLII